MKKLLLILIAASLLLTACGQHIYQPDEIRSVAISSGGGYLSQTNSFDWDFETMIFTNSCRNSGSSDETEHTEQYRLTEDDLSAMTDAMNEADAFRWHKKYGGNTATDETVDSFCIALKNGKILYINFIGTEKPPEYQSVHDVLFAHNGMYSNLENRVYTADEIQSYEISDCGGYLSGYQIETWDFDTLTYTNSFESGPETDMDEWSKSCSFTGENATEILNALNQYGAFTYNREYDDPDGVSDGAGTWLTIRFTDGTQWKTYFLDHKPPHYDELVSALRQPVPDDIKLP